MQRLSAEMPPDNKVHGAHLGFSWGRQDPGGPMWAPWKLLSGAPCMANQREVPSKENNVDFDVFFVVSLGKLFDK